MTSVTSRLCQADVTSRIKRGKINTFLFLPISIATAFELLMTSQNDRSLHSYIFKLLVISLQKVFVGKLKAYRAYIVIVLFCFGVGFCFGFVFVGKLMNVTVHRILVLI